MAHWRRRLEEADVPYTVIATVDEVVADPQMAANGVFRELDDPVLGRVRTVDTPLCIEGQAKAPAAPAPRLGEHTREILGEIGIGEAEIRSLLERRVVAERG